MPDTPPRSPSSPTPNAAPTPTPNTDDPAALAEALIVLARRVHTLDAREAARERLSATQAALLAQLVEHGPTRVGALADLLRCGSPTVSGAADALVRKGLARRVADPVDARASLLVPTMKGRRAGTRAREVPPGLERALAALPEGSRRALAEALGAARRAVEDELRPAPDATGHRVRRRGRGSAAQS